MLKTKNKKKDEETTVSKNCEVNSQPIHTTGVMSLEKQLSSTFSVGYFLQIKNGIDRLSSLIKIFH